MPIITADILFRYSNSLAVSGNNDSGSPTGPGNAATQCLGKFVSTAQWPGGGANDLFPDITGEQNANGYTDYRGLFIHNSHATLTALNSVMYISSEVAGGADTAIGIDPTAASILGSLSDQAVTIATAIIAPVGVAFSSPMTLGTAISLGNIPAGQVKGFWVRRTIFNVPPVNNDGFEVKFHADSLN